MPSYGNYTDEGIVRYNVNQLTKYIFVWPVPGVKAFKSPSNFSVSQIFYNGAEVLYVKFLPKQHLGSDIWSSHAFSAVW